VVDDNGKQSPGPAPLFFVSVASKGVRSAVSLLFATLAREPISIASKGFIGAWYWREGNLARPNDLGGV
jgi:hypothetical protein